MSADGNEPAAFRVPGGMRFFFGDRWEFAIECELQDREFDPWGSREPFGSFWIWIGGQLVGNPHKEEQLIHGFGPLCEIARKSHEMSEARFGALSNADKLSLIVWAGFGEDDEFDSERWRLFSPEEVRRENFSAYELIRPGSSPFVDGWEAILVEDGGSETFIWRHGRVSEIHEVSLPEGRLAEIAHAACLWFYQVRFDRVGPDKPPSDEKPRLVRRIN